jgi:hypothetical protein
MAWIGKFTRDLALAAFHRSSPFSLAAFLLQDPQADGALNRSCRL